MLAASQRPFIAQHSAATVYCNAAAICNRCQRPSYCRITDSVPQAGAHPFAISPPLLHAERQP